MAMSPVYWISSLFIAIQICFTAMQIYFSASPWSWFLITCWGHRHLSPKRTGTLLTQELLYLQHYVTSSSFTIQCPCRTFYLSTGTYKSPSLVETNIPPSIPSHSRHRLRCSRLKTRLFFNRFEISMLLFLWHNKLYFTSYPGFCRVYYHLVDTLIAFVTYLLSLFI